MTQLMKRISKSLTCGTIAAVALIGIRAGGQSTLDRPVGEDRPFDLDTGLISNPDDQFRTVFTDVIQIEGAAWMRLYFRDVQLTGESFVRVTSARDGEVQTLDAATAAMWSDSSAYFNGDTVFLDLVAGPGAAGVRISLEKVAVQFPHPGVDGECGICGPDDRFPTNEPEAGRLVPVGCTATIWTRSSCLVSAGHCMGNGLVMEFNVPPSNPDCSLNHPPIEDQFPIVDYDYHYTGVGADWAVLTTGVNNLGETAYEHQGAMRTISPTVANVNDPINVWGYAIDPDCVLSQTQQQSPGGVITARQTTWYEYNADITFGNSGSSIINERGEIIGIVTHCSYGCPNYGTRVDNSDFAAAREAMCPGGGELLVSSPTPGLAGRVNEVVVENASEGQVIWLVYGFRSGSTAVPDCPGVFVDIANPVIAGNAVADENGVAGISGFVPAAARGIDMLFQAAELSECRVSNLEPFTFM